MQKIKAFFYAVIVAVIAFLYAAFRVQKAEKEKIKQYADHVSKVNDDNELKIKVLDEISKTNDDVDHASDHDIDVMLKSYDRSRKD